MIRTETQSSPVIKKDTLIINTKKATSGTAKAMKLLPDQIQEGLDVPIAAIEIDWITKDAENNARGFQKKHHPSSNQICRRNQYNLARTATKVSHYTNLKDVMLERELTVDMQPSDTKLDGNKWLDLKKIFNLYRSIGAKKTQPNMRTFVAHSNSPGKEIDDILPPDPPKF
ncbi:hypothetical protein CHS0354_027962 [Potamilus streckersoni]|uniref:Uncharacterized protein n=1 Tax=Potamilus streckersoni TaxID=2493646 RepID=A0AAE0W7R4_9BIVA|nr:hypothetical protein CHS0354_027962 [Potamilus streckersoni]